MVVLSSRMLMMVVRAGINFQHALATSLTLSLVSVLSFSLFLFRFHLAASRGHLDCLNLFLNHGVDVTATDATGEDFALDGRV